MAHKLDLEARMSIKKLDERGVSRSETARILGVTEGAVRYHLRRMADGSTDGRARQTCRAAAFHDAILRWLEAQGDRGAVNLAGLHEYLVAEHDYDGSRRSVQRYFRKAFPKPKRRARRRVETPPGAQAQVDWGHFPDVIIGHERVDLLAFVMQLSSSRADAVIWSRRKDLLSWLACHNRAFERLGGIPATARVDNEKTAVVRGAGAWCYVARPMARLVARSLA